MDELKAFAGRRVFVTGVTGTLGGEFAAVARQAGASVRAPSRHEGFDLRERAKVSAEIAGFRPEFIFHFAAAGVSQALNEAELQAINVEGLEHLLAAAAALPAPPRCLLLGTCAEYASSDDLHAEDDSLSPRNAYARSKVAAAEVAKRQAGSLPLLWLRMFNVYGAGEKLPRLLPYLVGCARDGVAAEVTAGAQLLDYTSARDAAAIFGRLGLSLPDQPGWQACNVGSGRAITARQFMETVRASLRRHGLALDLRFGAKAYREGDAMRCLPDLSRLRSWIGEPDARPPEIGLAEAIDRMLVRPSQSL
jgi:nucleoside-diphosphate-sugar epimerase